MKTILIYPGFVIDTWCSIEQRYIWLDEPLKDHFNVYWLIPPTGSKYSRCKKEENRNKEPIYVSKLKEINAKLIYCDITKYNFIKNFFMLRKIFKDYKIDAVYTHFGFLRYYVELIAKISGVKVIRGEHGFTFHKKRRFKLLKWLFWKSTTDYYIPVSNAVAKHLEEKRLLKNNVYVVYDGFDIEDFPTPNYSENRQRLIEEFGLPQDAKIISCIAQIEERKQQHILIEMLHKLKRNEVFLFIVGTLRNEKAKKYEERLRKI